MQNDHIWAVSLATGEHPEYSYCVVCQAHKRSKNGPCSGSTTKTIKTAFTPAQLKGIVISKLAPADQPYLKDSIERTERAVKRSSGLWLTINRLILSVLQEGQTSGISIENIAEVLHNMTGEEAGGGGPLHKTLLSHTTPTSFNNLYAAIQQLRDREPISLL